MHHFDHVLAGVRMGLEVLRSGASFFGRSLQQQGVLQAAEDLSATIDAFYEYAWSIYSDLYAAFDIVHGVRTDMKQIKVRPPVDQTMTYVLSKAHFDATVVVVNKFVAEYPDFYDAKNVGLLQANIVTFKAEYDIFSRSADSINNAYAVPNVYAFT